MIERLAREEETDPHSKPVTKRKDEKLCFPVKFDVGKKNAAIPSHGCMDYRRVRGNHPPPPPTPVGWQRCLEAASTRRRRLRWNGSMFSCTEPRRRCTPGGDAKMQCLWSACFCRINEGCPIYFFKENSKKRVIHQFLSCNEMTRKTQIHHARQTHCHRRHRHLRTSSLRSSRLSFYFTGV